MARDLSQQLRYLGVIPQAGYVEYGFRVEDKDKSVRLIVLEIADRFFETKELMMQEAPDLCFQKVLAEAADLPPDAHIAVTQSDIEHYREMHPTKSRKSFRKS